jgi:hypothetical protein
MDAVLGDDFPVWVKRVGFVMSAVCPVYTQQRTFPDPVGTSHLCHERKSRCSSITTSTRVCNWLDMAAVLGLAECTSTEIALAFGSSDDARAQILIRGTAPAMSSQPREL